MKLSRFYKRVIEFGRDRDPRKNKRIKAYEDTAILYGHPGTEVKKIMVGIDIDPSELLLADKIRREEGLDLVIAHHPEGRAWASFYEVMNLQVDMLEKIGLPRKTAQGLLEERKLEVARRVMPQNHMRSVDVARLLDLPFMCIHTPADNQVAYFIKALLDKKKPKKVEDLITILKEIPEYKDAQKELSGPKIILGSPKRPVGKVFMEMTGGTEGPKDVFDKMYKLGIRTLLSMHLGEEHFKKVKDANLNVVIAGHISSDTLGLNLLLDRIEEEEGLEVVSCSGFRRFRHK